MKGYVKAQLAQAEGMYKRLEVLHQAIDRHIGICIGYLKNAERILDVGCFDGYFLEKLNDRSVVKGFDINGINVTNALLRKIDVIEWDARNGLPYGNEKFDFINVHHVLEHIPQKNQKEFVFNLCGALNKDGHLCIVVPIEKIKLTLKHPGIFNSWIQLDILIPFGYRIVERIGITKGNSEIYYLFIEKNV